MAGVTSTLKVLFMVCTKWLGHNVINVAAWGASTTALGCKWVSRVTYLPDHAERITPDDHDSEPLPSTAIAAFSRVSTLTVKLSASFVLLVLFAVAAFRDQRGAAGLAAGLESSPGH
jgi:hypothetical protein